MCEQVVRVACLWSWLSCPLPGDTLSLPVVSSCASPNTRAINGVTLAPAQQSSEWRNDVRHIPPLPVNRHRRGCSQISGKGLLGE